MDLIFTNGTATQKALWKEGLGLMRGLPLDALPLTVEISFVPPSEIGQTHFAETTATYGSAESTVKVRNDAPGFGDVDAALIAEAHGMGIDYDARLHFHETAVHETGHSLFAALPEEVRLAILALFGIHTDDPDVLAPPGSDWHDRPIEAIAETFKDAFLPTRHRIFPNRTNIKLSYSKYPEFRRLVREAIPQIVIEGSLGPGETAVPAYNFDYLAVGEPLPFQGWSPPNYSEGTDGKHGIHSTAMDGGPDIIPERGNSYFMAGESVASAWVKHGTVLSFTLALDDNAFPDQQNELRFDLFYHSFVAGPIFPKLFSGRWLSQLEDPEFPRYSEEEPEAIAIGDPPFSHTKLITVDSRFTQTRFCNGSVYRFVELVGFMRQTFLGAYTLASHEALRAAHYYPYVPELRVAQSSCPPPAAVGQPVDMPPALIEPAGVRRGGRPSPRPIVGH